MREEHLETQRAEGTSIVQRLLENLDILAAVAAAVLVALHFMGWLFPLPVGSADALRQLAETKAVVERTLGASGYDVAKAVGDAEALVNRVHAAWGPVSGRIPEVKPGFGWPPELVEALRKGEPNEIRFPAPVDLQADPEAGFNLVRWLVDETNNVTLSGFVVLRAEASGPFKEIARVAVEATRFEDRDIKPGASYTYRIVALTDDPAVRGAGVERSPESKPATVQALADYKLALLDADTVAKTAIIQVEKWRDGTWWPKKFTVTVGQTIGELDPGSGVDYATGRSLEALTSEQKSETRVRKEVLFDETGRGRTAGAEPLTEEVEANEPFLEITARVGGGGIAPESLRLEKK